MVKYIGVLPFFYASILGNPIHLILQLMLQKVIIVSCISPFKTF